MPRALVSRALQVPSAERSDALATFRRRRAACAALGCNYWVFERPDDDGAFTEFLEARDTQLLARALVETGVAGEGVPILREVEL